MYIRTVTDVLLSLGSNTGDSRVHLETAIVHLAGLPRTKVLGTSSIHTTAPWGKTDQPDFLNISVLLATDLTVVELMENILSIEELMGRKRTEKWGPRLIDIDIILFGSEIVNSSVVVVPHPLMADRTFVLGPSVEIAGAMMHPVLGKSIAELFNDCKQRELAGK